MSLKRYYKKEDPNKVVKEQSSAIVKAYLPTSLHEKLRELSKARGLPMSRLVAIAIDNELDQAVPFTYNVDLPDTEYQEYLYVGEASKVLHFLCKFPEGMGVDFLCLARRDIGLPDRDTVLQALRELLEKDMVELVKPSGKAKFKLWHDEYYVVRAKDLQVKDSKIPRFKKIEGTNTKYVKRIADKDVEI